MCQLQVRTRTLIRSHGWVEIRNQDQSKYNDQLAWCNEKLNPDDFRARNDMIFLTESRYRQTMGSQFVFKNNKDATIFKLKWGQND